MKISSVMHLIYHYCKADGLNEFAESIDYVKHFKDAWRYWCYRLRAGLFIEWYFVWRKWKCTSDIKEYTFIEDVGVNDQDYWG